MVPDASAKALESPRREIQIKRDQNWEMRQSRAAAKAAERRPLSETRQSDEGEPEQKLPQKISALRKPSVKRATKGQEAGMKNFPNYQKVNLN